LRNPIFPANLHLLQEIVNSQRNSRKLVLQNLSTNDEPGELKAPTNRSFGLVVSVACVIYALYPAISGKIPHWWLLGIGAVFLLLAIVQSALLTPLNRIWIRLGLLMAKVANPIVLGIMYYLLVSPIAIGMTLAGRDSLKRKFAPELVTYWQDKTPAGPSPETMRNQF